MFMNTSLEYILGHTTSVEQQKIGKASYQMIWEHV